MWNPSPTTYLTAIISETWGKTDDPSIISWQRPSSWFNSGYLSKLHEGLLRDALVFGVDCDIVWKKCIAEGNDLTLKKPREITCTLTKLPGYSSTQLQAKQIQHKSTHYTEPKTTPKPNREARETTKPSSLKLPCWGPWRKKTLRSDWSRHLFLGFSYCEAMITFNENFSKHWEI